MHHARGVASAVAPVSVSLSVCALVSALVLAGAVVPGPIARANVPPRHHPLDAGVPSDASVVTPADASEHEGVSQAQRERAGEAFAAGLEAYRRGEYATAAEHFEIADRTLPDPSPVFNIGRAWEGANEIGRAIEAYERYLARAPGAPDRVEVLERIELLRARPADVFVSSEPPGALVYVDDEHQAEPARTPTVVHLAPGPHNLALSLDGGRRRVSQHVVIEPGVPQTFAVTLPSEAAGPAVALAQMTASQRILSRREGHAVSPRATLIVGVARPFNGQGYQATAGLEATAFFGRAFFARAHFERVEPDGSWTLLAADAGWTFLLDDIDLGAALTLGAGTGWLDHDAFVRHDPMVWVGTVGLDLRAEWVFHPRLSFGLFARGTLRNVFVAPVEPLNSFGVCVSLHP